MKTLSFIPLITVFAIVGCATVTITRPPRFTGAEDSSEGLVLFHDGLPGDRLVFSAEDSKWEQSEVVPNPGSSSILAGVGIRTKVVKDSIAIAGNPDFDIPSKIRKASEVTTGSNEVVIGTISLEGKSRRLTIRIVEPQVDGFL